MGMQLFRSKKNTTPKGNAIKKAGAASEDPVTATTEVPGLRHVELERPQLGDRFGSSYEWNDLQNKEYSVEEKEESEQLLTANDLIKELGKSEPDMNAKAAGRRESVLDHIKSGDLYHAGLLKDTSSDQKDRAISPEEDRDKSPVSVPLKHDSHAEVLLESATNDYSPTRMIPSMTNLLLGQQDTTSRYFTRRFMRIRDSSTPSSGSSSVSSSPSPSRSRADSPLELSHFDPHAFELYKIWLHSRTLPTYSRNTCYYASRREPQHTWQICWPLMNAVILGHTMGEPDFTDCVMDMLEETIVKGVCADAETISHIFFDGTKDDIPHVLKQFIVDRALDTGVEGFKDLDMVSMPTSFAHLALQTALRRLSHGGQVPLTSGCEYHTHENLEDCHKNKRTAAQIRKDVALEMQREKSRCDKEVIGSNAERNGVKSVDWEDRKAEANLTIYEETGRRWAALKENAASQPEVKMVMMNSAGPGALDEGDPSKTGVSAGSQNSHPSPTTDMFGTTQTGDTVDEIKIAPPTRTPPPPPAPVELQGSAAYVMRHLESTPAYRGDPVIMISEATPPASTTDGGSNSPSHSASSTESKRDAELRAGLQMALDFEERAKCPGAFPESRSGSLRSSGS